LPKEGEKGLISSEGDAFLREVKRRRHSLRRREVAILNFRGGRRGETLSLVVEKGKESRLLHL